MRSKAVRQRARALHRASGAPCHICGQPINHALPYYDPMSFVVDHVIPIARGGLDAIENTAPAHRGCNRAKSDKAHAPILRRSGTLG